MRLFVKMPHSSLYGNCMIQIQMNPSNLLFKNLVKYPRNLVLCLTFTQTAAFVDFFPVLCCSCLYKGCQSYSAVYFCRPLINPVNFD